MKYKYYVMQGGMSENGNGDYCCYGEFTNLKEALKCFNKVKKENNYKDVYSIDTCIEKHEIIDGDISWEFDYVKYDKRLLKRVVI